MPDGATRKSNNRRVLTLKTRTWLNSSSKKAWKTRVTWVKTRNTRAKFKLDSCSNSTVWNLIKLELDENWAWSGTSLYYLQIRSAQKGPFCIPRSVYQQGLMHHAFCYFCAVTFFFKTFLLMSQEMFCLTFNLFWNIYLLPLLVFGTFSSLRFNESFLQQMSLVESFLLCKSSWFLQNVPKSFHMASENLLPRQ